MEEKILGILPHGKEAILVDSILELEPGKKAVAKKVFKSFSGHFLKVQFAPVSVLLEVAHQVGQIAICSEVSAIELIKGGFLPLAIALDEIRKIRCKVFPQDVFTIEALVDRPYKGPYHPGHVSWRAWSNGKKVMEGGFSFTFQKIEEILKEKESRTF